MSVIDNINAGIWPDLNDPAIANALASFDPTSAPAPSAPPADDGSGVVAGNSASAPVIQFPGLPPILQEIGDDLSILYNIAEVVAALLAEVAFIPILNIILALLEIILQLLPFLEGRPRDQATMWCAQNLLGGKNSAGVIAGNAILRMYQSWNVVISESGPGEALVAAVVAQMVNNLEGQGKTLAEARAIVIAQYTTGANQQNFRVPFLDQPTDPTLPVYGPTGFQRIYQILLNDFLQKGFTEAVASEKAMRDLLQNGPMKWITRLYIGQQPAQPPSPPPPPPPPPPVVLPPPNWPVPDPQGDSITNELCTQITQCAQGVAYYLQEMLQAQQGGTVDETCCANVVSAIAGVTGAINAIVSALPSLGGGGAGAPDLSPIVDALTSLTNAVGAIASAPAADLAPVTAALEAINSTLAGGEPFDQSNLAKIAAAQNTIAEQGDVPPALLEQLIASGVIPKSMSGFLQGSPWSSVMAAIQAWSQKAAHATWWQDASYIIRLLESINAGDPGGAPLPSLDDPPLGGPDASTALANGTAAALKKGFAVANVIASPFVAGILQAHESELAGLSNVMPGDELATATNLLTEASTFGIGAHFAAVCGEALYPTKTLGFPQLAATLALFSGYDEIIKGVLGTEVSAAITTPHRYLINARARSIMPNAGAALTLWARRKLLTADRDQLLAWNGVSQTYAPAEEAGAYRPVSSRAVATLTQDAPFPTAQMQAILEDNALAPADATFMLDLLQYNSTKTLRNSYVGAAETAYAKGVLGDDELESILQNVGWSTDAIALVKSKVAIQRREVLAAKVEAQVIPLVRNGLITPDEGSQQLEAAGLQQWYVDLEITLATTQATIHAAVKEAQAEAKLAIQRQREATKIAIAEFQRGVLNEATLTAALLAAGLDPVLVASTVAVQDATRTGRLRLIYGQLMLPADAKILTDRVAAIGAQVHSQLITLAQGEAQLAALGVDQPEINALVARWLASLQSASTVGYLVSPLTGQRPPQPIGGIAIVTTANGGTGYALGDTGTITGGNNDAAYSVLQISTGGVVQSIGILPAGTGYVVASGVTTSPGGAQPGAGTGLTVNIIRTT